MKVSLEWLRAFAPLPGDAQGVAEAMMHAGNEVEEIIDPHALFSGVVVCRIVSTQKHPDADKLQICQADCGDGQLIQIVTAAPNARAGIVVPLCRIGAILVDGTKISKAKMRGVESHGMFGGGSELGLTDGHYPGAELDALLELDENTPLGIDLGEVVGLSSKVFDFKPLANRPDCQSVLGLAAEAAAVMSVPLTVESPVVPEGLPTSKVAINVVDADDCPLYTAMAVTGVKVAPSPAWMRHRLLAGGIRPINNIVDITNYVMLEYGQPLHAFDRRQLRGTGINVRRATAGESLMLLDGKELSLTPDELCICDGEGPVALAGVMGGERSGIAEDTTDVLIEAAVFDAVRVRVTSRKLGVRTESSGRFEKGIDRARTLAAGIRAAQLMVELGGGKLVSQPVVVGGWQNNQVVTARLPRIRALLGVDIPTQTCIDLLARLHMPAVAEGDVLKVTVPNARRDVAGDADIAEEIMRLYGYEHIPSVPLQGELTPGGYGAARRWREKASDVLVGYGFFEAMNYSFISPEQEAQVGGHEGLTLLNPLGADLSRMRTSLLPGLLVNLAHNTAHRAQSVRLFELNKVFLPRDGELPDEPWRLGLCAYGDMDFYGIKAIVEGLCEAFGHTVEYRAATHPLMHPGRCAQVFADEVCLGIFGELHPDVCRTRDIAPRALIAELDADALCAPATIFRFVPIPTQPPIERDVALVMDEGVTAGQVMAVIRQVWGKALISVAPFDLYRGPGVGEGKKSVAFALRIARANLDDDAVRAKMDKMINKIQAACGAVMRS